MVDAKKIRDIVIIVFSILALVGLGVMLYIFQNNQNDEIKQVAMDAAQHAQQAHSDAEHVKAVSGEGIVINEVSSQGWIELFNTAKDSAELRGLRVFVNGVETILEEGELKSGEYYVVDMKKSFVDEKMQVSLANASGITMQSLCIPRLGINESYATEKDGDQNYLYMRGSKGKTNSDSQLVKKSSPFFKLPSGFYPTDIKVEIQIPEGCTVYYTLDGSEPDEASTVYEGAIALSNATWNPNVLAARTDLSINSSYVPADKIDKANIIRAVAIDDKGNRSEVVTGTYFVAVGADNSYTAAPIISIVTDNEGLFNYWSGIYVKGRGYDDAIARGSNTREASNYCYGHPVDANLEIFDDNERKIEECIGSMAVHFDYNANQIQKSLSLTIDDAEILLSAGEEDYLFRMRDPILTDLWTDEQIIVQNTQSYIVFINGEFWGLYFSKDRMDSHTIADKLGAEPDNIQVVKEGYCEDYEVRTQWSDILDYAMVNDMTDERFYSKVKEAIDLESLAKVYAYNIYFGNTNFNSSSSCVYRDVSEEVPKWRYVIYDLENTMETTAVSEYSIDTFLYPGISHDYVLYSLMRNEEFSSMFDVEMTKIANRIATHDRVAPIVEEYVKHYEKILAKTHERFYGSSYVGYAEKIGGIIIDYVDNRWNYLEVYLDEFLTEERPLIRWKLGDKGYEIVVEEEKGKKR